MKIEVIIEKSGAELWGRIEGKGDYLPTTVGYTTEEVLHNLRELIQDYLTNEGRYDKYWMKALGKELEFDLSYDVQTFFSEHEEVKISVIAKRAGINPALMRQYSSGVKHPSKERAKQIEVAIHKLADELRAVSLYV